MNKKAKAYYTTSNGKKHRDRKAERELNAWIDRSSEIIGLKSSRQKVLKFWLLWYVIGLGIILLSVFIVSAMQLYNDGVGVFLIVAVSVWAMGIPIGILHIISKS